MYCNSALAASGLLALVEMKPVSLMGVEICLGRTPTISYSRILLLLLLIVHLEPSIRQEANCFSGISVRLVESRCFFTKTKEKRFFLFLVSQDWVRQKSPNHPGLNSVASHLGLDGEEARLRRAGARQMATGGGELGCREGRGGRGPCK